ncbi:cyclolysin-activating lysine-acyltransferase, partial [Bordetella bronchiseptica MO149]
PPAPPCTDVMLPSAQAPSAPHPTDDFAALGNIAWLWMNSPMHRDWPVHLLARNTLAPIQLGQYILLRCNGVPVAYCSWALMDADTELSYVMAPSSLGGNAWNCGDRLWIIDWIAPFSRDDNRALRRALAERHPDSVGRSLRVRRGGDTARIKEYRGRALDAAAARAQLDRYHAELIAGLRASNGGYAPRGRGTA